MLCRPLAATRRTVSHVRASLGSKPRVREPSVSKLHPLVTSHRASRPRSRGMLSHSILGGPVDLLGWRGSNARECLNEGRGTVRNVSTLRSRGTQAMCSARASKTQHRWVHRSLLSGGLKQRWQAHSLCQIEHCMGDRLNESSALKTRAIPTVCQEPRRLCEIPVGPMRSRLPRLGIYSCLSSSLYQQLRSTMKGVIIKGLHEVAVEERDRPTIERPTDVILKMRVAGLCGKSKLACHCRESSLGSS